MEKIDTASNLVNFTELGKHAENFHCCSSYQADSQRTALLRPQTQHRPMFEITSHLTSSLFFFFFSCITCPPPCCCCDCKGVPVLQTVKIFFCQNYNSSNNQSEILQEELCHYHCCGLWSSNMLLCAYLSKVSYVFSAEFLFLPLLSLSVSNHNIILLIFLPGLQFVEDQFTC